MVRLSALVTTADPALRDTIARVLRASGIPLSLVEERASVVIVPDVVVVDIRGEGSPGLPAVEQIRARWPTVAIFVVAEDPEPTAILEAMRAGANEFFAWPRDAHDVPPAVATAIREALQRLEARCQAARGDRNQASRVFSFFGAKGGTGTTTLAVNCGAELARLTERPTAVIDLNPFLGEVALFLGVRPRFTVLDAIDNLQRLDADFLAELVAKHSSGLEILAGSDMVDRPNDQDASGLEALVQCLRRSYDFVVLDAGGVTSPCAAVGVSAADEIFIVATPDVPSIRNTQRLVDRMEQMGAGHDQVRILLNRTSAGHLIAPEQIANAVARPIQHTFPSDYGTVAAALNAGVPIAVHNQSALAAELGRFVRNLANLPAEEGAGGGRRRSALLGLF